MQDNISQKLPSALALVFIVGAWAPSVQARRVTIPVVVNGVSGQNGSVWETEVRIFNLRSTQSPRVKRSWVAIPEGGFEDIPSTAPNWTFPEREGSPGYFSRMLILVGSDLLLGADALIGAVGLEVDGDVDVQFRAVETGGRPRLPNFAPSPSSTCCWPGTGALVTAPGELLSGNSHLPWLSGNGFNWQTDLTHYYRTNLAFVNPGSKSIALEAQIAELGCALCYQVGPDLFWNQAVTGSRVSIVLKPFQWLQVNDFYFLAEPWCPTDCPEFSAVAPGIANISSASDDQYYAYASIIDETTNSSMFVPALPGGADIEN